MAFSKYLCETGYSLLTMVKTKYPNQLQPEDDTDVQWRPQFLILMNLWNKFKDKVFIEVYRVCVLSVLTLFAFYVVPNYLILIPITWVCVHIC